MEYVETLRMLFFIQNRLCVIDNMVGSPAKGWEKYRISSMTVEQSTRSMPVVRDSLEYKRELVKRFPPEYGDLILRGTIGGMVQVYTPNAMIEALESPQQVDARKSSEDAITVFNYKWRYPRITQVGDMREIHRLVSFARLRLD
jgi:hypothetical protein